MYKLKRTFFLMIVLFSMSCSLFGKPIDVIYLIPNGYTGGVIILYNQSDGIIPEITDDGTIIYPIPNDGFLKVKSPLKRESYKFTYYFVDATNNRMPIEYVYPRYYVRDPGDTTSKSLDTITEDERVHTTFVMNHITTSFNRGVEKVYLYNFLVGKPSNINKLYNKVENRIDEIQKGISNFESNSKITND